MLAWIDGLLVDWEKANLPLLSYSFGRGVAIFEVFSVLETKLGPAIFCLAEHIARFFRSAELIRLDLPLTRAELAEAVLTTARENRVRAGLGKFFAYYPEVSIPYNSGQAKVSVAVFCAEPAAFGVDPKKSWRKVKVGLSSLCKLHPASVPVQAKVTGYYISSHLAMMEATAKGYDYPILADTSGHLAEGANQSCFFIKDKVLLTALKEGILEGTTQLVVRQVAKELGYPVREALIPVEELAGFDEAFLTGTVVRLVPIESIDGQPLGRTCPGPVTEAIMGRMAQLYRGELEADRRWLTFI